MEEIDHEKLREIEKKVENAYKKVRDINIQFLMKSLLLIVVTVLIKMLFI